MVKKLKATSQLFSVAAKNARAAIKAAAIAQREQMLDQSIVFDDMMAPSEGCLMNGWKPVYLDGWCIAVFSCANAAGYVKLEFDDVPPTEIEIRNLAACKSLLTYRNVDLANRRPNGVVDLVKLIRLREAEAEAEQLWVDADLRPATISQNRL